MATLTDLGQRDSSRCDRIQSTRHMANSSSANLGKVTTTIAVKQSNTKPNPNRNPIPTTIQTIQFCHT